MWRFSGRPGACSVTTSDAASSSGRLTYSTSPESSSFSTGSHARTRQPKPCSSRATHEPMAPVPTTPTVQLPSDRPILPSSEKSCAAAHRWTNLTLRSAMSISMIA